MRDEAPRLDQDSRLRRGRASFPTRQRIGHEAGAIAIMTSILLIVIFGFFMLALDLSQVYNRKAEMQTLADAVAIAAAGKVNGTRSGIDAALTAAQDVVALPMYGPKYAYVKTLTWANAALAFGPSRDGSGGWKTASEAMSSPAGLKFVKVDSSLLDGDYGTVAMFFAPILSSLLSSVKVGQVTIAGKSRLHVTPLAICAMSTAAQSKYKHTSDAQYDELVEYGFRRGVGYDLMKLNPNGAAALSFQVDPVSLAGGGSTASNFGASIYGPYICTGTMDVPNVTGAQVGVRSLFPIGTYYAHLNSRFDPYTATTCDINTSPPDSNVKQYPFASVSWMSVKATVQVAKQDPSATTKLQTVAEIGPPNHPTAVDYGALWTFARAVPWSSSQTQGLPEPTGGYTPFDATPLVWSKLYGSTSAVGTYPSATPYLMSSGSAYYQIPPTVARRPGGASRRVLNIPLLSCPVTSASATVLAIGKFLMTVPADATSIYAEFGGIATDEQLGASVEIYQ